MMRVTTYEKYSLAMICEPDRVSTLMLKSLNITRKVSTFMRKY